MRKASRSRSPRRKTKAGRRRKTRQVGGGTLLEDFKANKRLPVGIIIEARLADIPWGLPPSGQVGRSWQTRRARITGFQPDWRPGSARNKYRLEFEPGYEPIDEDGRGYVYPTSDTDQQGFSGWWNLNLAREKRVISEEEEQTPEIAEELKEWMAKEEAAEAAAAAVEAEIRDEQEKLYRIRRQKLLKGMEKYTGDGGEWGWGNPGPATPELAAGAAAPTAPAEGGFTVPGSQ